MSEASLSAQQFAVATMRARPELTALVPAANILDRHQRPEVFPCVLVGEGQTVDASADCVEGSEVFLQIHVWTKEKSFLACKNIAGEVRRALRRQSGTNDGHRLDFNFDDVLYLRDPSGEHSHGVMNFTVYAEETT